MKRTRQRRGRDSAFVLAEAITLVVIVAVAAALLLIASHDNRRRSMLGGSIDNLRQIGAGVFAFGADNDDRIASFTWRPGVTYRADDGYVFPPAANYNEAAANQAVAIIRRRAQRTDITAMTGWYPHSFYNLLVLADYMQNSLPQPTVASPGDLHLLAWQRHHLDIVAFFNFPAGPHDNPLRRWPYRSSYEFAPASISPDAASGGLSTISQAFRHNLWSIPPDAQVVLGNRRLREVAFPSQKALVFETTQRFFGSRELFFAYDEARVPCLYADGTVSVRTSSRVNPGFQPNYPSNPLPTRFRYEPDPSWEPPTANGFLSELVNGHQRWTRSGLRGRDTGGPEVPWQ